MSVPLQFQQLDADTPDWMYRQLAVIHCEQIAGGFLTKLGPEFLNRLYRAVVASPEAVVIVARRDDVVAGFIAGSTSTRSVYRTFLRKQAWRSLPQLVPVLLRPTNFHRLWETWRYPTKPTRTNLPAAEILNFCIAAPFQRHGIGKRLFAELVQEFKQRRVPAFKIVTGGNQSSAHAFYESVGAHLVDRIEVHRGARSLVYWYSVVPGRLPSHLLVDSHAPAA